MGLNISCVFHQITLAVLTKQPVIYFSSMVGRFYHIGCVTQPSFLSRLGAWLESSYAGIRIFQILRNTVFELLESEAEQVINSQDWINGAGIKRHCTDFFDSYNEDVFLCFLPEMTM